MQRRKNQPGEEQVSYFTQFKIRIPWEQFIKAGILICFVQISKNNQVELLYQILLHSYM